MRNVSLMLLPVIPEKAGEALGMIGLSPDDAGYGEYFGFLKDGGKVEKGGSLFPKIEDE